MCARLAGLAGVLSASVVWDMMGREGQGLYIFEPPSWKAVCTARSVETTVRDESSSRRVCRKQHHRRRRNVAIPPSRRCSRVPESKSSCSQKHHRRPIIVFPTSAGSHRLRHRSSTRGVDVTSCRMRTGRWDVEEDDVSGSTDATRPIMSTATTKHRSVRPTPPTSCDAVLTVFVVPSVAHSDSAQHPSGRYIGVSEDTRHA